MRFQRVIIAAIALNTISLSGASAFEAVNKLKLSGSRNAPHGLRIITRVREQMKQEPYFDEIARMTVEDVLPPYKVSVDFVLRYRLAKTELARMSNIVRDAAGGRYERYFVGFYLEGEHDSGYWASAHQDPNVEVKILGSSAEKHGESVDRIAAYKPPPGEKIIADAIIRLGLKYDYHFVILRTKKGYVGRSYYLDGNAWSENPVSLRKKGGRYWEKGNAFKESYRIQNGMLEVHDAEGIITKSPITKR